MENYESLGTIGEGTYGVVLKCRHKTTGQIVAIKKFKESDDDEQVKKTALREIKILKQLKHENIVNLLEVFRVKGKLYLVFEFVEKTILEEIEKNPEGLDPRSIKQLMWQLVRSIDFCHQHNIIHRDIKPENLLVSRNGVLKLCDFGFARPLASAGAKYTEYVSTRWYRAPELLVGDVSYGKAVDIWSIGCMFAEITTGLPLFPGDSDIDQLYHIIRCLGHITSRQQELFRKNSLYVGVKLPQPTEREPLETRFSHLDKNSIDFMRQTIQDEPLDRWTCAELLKHPFFENSHEIFEAELQEAIKRDLNDTAVLLQKKKRIRKPPRPSVTNENLPSSSISTNLSGYDETPVVDVKNQAFKPTFKPITNLYQSVPKEKLVHNNNSHIHLTKKHGGININGSGGGGAGIASTTYHLPTLAQNSMTSSSSSILTSGTSSNTSSSSTTSDADNSPYGPIGKKTTVAPITENQPMPIQPISSEHMEYIHQHATMRQSMTSHGARYTSTNPNGFPSPSMHPYTLSTLGGVRPKPPLPSSYMKNPYLAQSSPLKKVNGTSKGQESSSGRRNHDVAGDSTSSSMTYILQSSVDIYSPKKLGAQVNGKKGTAVGGTTMAMDMTPQGIHVPPRTSHNTMRSHHVKMNGESKNSISNAHKARRDKDICTF